MESPSSGMLKINVDAGCYVMATRAGHYWHITMHDGNVQIAATDTPLAVGLRWWLQWNTNQKLDDLILSVMQKWW